MKDVLFDLENREIVIAGNDFETTENPSVQNGGIILYSSGANPLRPALGVGIIKVVNGNVTNLAYEMNRWQTQLNEDGATIAKWSAEPVNGDAAIHTEQSYL